jgi:hypothetical protein
VPKAQAYGEQKESAAPEQKAAPAAPSIRAIVRRFFGFATDGRFVLTIADLIHREVPRTRH